MMIQKAFQNARCAATWTTRKQVLDVMIEPDPIYYVQTTLLCDAPSLFEIVRIIAEKVITTIYVDSIAAVLV